MRREIDMDFLQVPSTDRRCDTAQMHMQHGYQRGEIVRSWPDILLTLHDEERTVFEIRSGASLKSTEAYRGIR